MAIKVQCPYCKTTLSAQNSYHHKMMKCPKCDEEFEAVTIDEKEAAAGVAKQRLEDLERRKAERAKKAKKLQEEQAKPAEQCAICGEPIHPTDFELGWAVRTENASYHTVCLATGESAPPAKTKPPEVCAICGTLLGPTDFKLRRAVRKGDQIYCVRCKPTPPDGTQIDQLVGRESAARAEAAQPSPVQDAPKLRTCPACGALLTDQEGPYCRLCREGRKSTRQAALLQHPVPQAPSRRAGAALPAARAEAPQISPIYHPVSRAPKGDESGIKWVAIAIIIAALIIIGGYIAYTEYNKYWARKAVEELFDGRKR